MKKYGMISLSVIFTLLIMLIPNQRIKAYSKTDFINFDYTSEIVQTYFETYKEQIDFFNNGILEKLKSQSYYDYIIYSYFSSSVPKFRVYLFEKDNANLKLELNSSVTDRSINFIDFKEGLVGYFDFNFKVDSWTSIGFVTTTSQYYGKYKYDGSFYDVYNIYEKLISSKTNELTTTYPQIHYDSCYYGCNNGTIEVNGRNIFDTFSISDAIRFIYNSSFPIYYVPKDINTFVPIDLTGYNPNRDLKISLDIFDNGQFLTYTQAMNLGGSQNTDFNELISTQLYSKIEFNFKLPLYNSICTKEEYVNGVLTKVEYECPSLDLNYNIFSSDNNGNVLSTIFGIPYISKSYLYDTGTMSKTQVDTIPLGNNMSNLYQGNYYAENDSNILELKLVVDLSSVDYSYVNLQFDSNTTFDVFYYERELENQYISSVDLTGKAGVMFIPKQINDDMFLNFSFYPNSYSIQLRDTYKSNFNILKYYSVGYCDDRDYIDDIPYICNNGTDYNISVEFKKGNSEQSLFVVNRDYPNDSKSIIYYDTRYFDYVVYNTLADNPTFIHPITGDEEISNSLIDFDSSMTKQESFFEMFKNGFNKFKNVIIDIFQNINYFFINLNIDLQYFYIVVFALIIFIFLTRFLL